MLKLTEPNHRRNTSYHKPQSLWNQIEDIIQADKKFPNWDAEESYGGIGPYAHLIVDDQNLNLIIKKITAIAASDPGLKIKIKQTTFKPSTLNLIEVFDYNSQEIILAEFKADLYGSDNYLQHAYNAEINGTNISINPKLLPTTIFPGNQQQQKILQQSTLNTINHYLSYKQTRNYYEHYAHDYLTNKYSAIGSLNIINTTNVDLYTIPELLKESFEINTNLSDADKQYLTNFI